MAIYCIGFLLSYIFNKLPNIYIFIYTCRHSKRILKSMWLTRVATPWLGRVPLLVVFINFLFICLSSVDQQSNYYSRPGCTVSLMPKENFTQCTPLLSQLAHDRFLSVPGNHLALLSLTWLSYNKHRHWVSLCRRSHCKNVGLPLLLLELVA